MKYMLIIYGNDELWTSFPPDQMQDIVGRTDALNKALVESGEMVGAFGVADQAVAKLVSVVGGESTVTDGPYIEAKEYIGSFTIVDVEDEARALQIAAQNPASEFTKVEVRALLHGGTADARRGWCGWGPAG